MPTTAPNKVRVGLKKIHYALLTETTSSTGTTYSYGTPVPIPGAVSANMTENGTENNFYADDIVYYRGNAKNGYTLDIEVALLPDSVYTALLGGLTDNNNLIVENSETGEKPRFALLFEFTGDQRAIRHCLYCCTASRGTQSGQTKGETVEPQTETMTINAIPRSDGLIKAKTTDTTTSTVFNAWYTSVQSPSFTTGGSGET